MEPAEAVSLGPWAGARPLTYKPSCGGLSRWWETGRRRKVSSSAEKRMSRIPGQEVSEGWMELWALGPGVLQADPRVWASKKQRWTDRWQAARERLRLG